MTPATDIGAAAGAMDRGLALFPIPAGGRVPAPGWQRRATSDSGALVGLLADGANVGVGCRASRVVALDLDVHEADGSARNGIETLRTQLDIQGLADWPETFTVMTPHRGLHLYFRVPADCTIGSVSGGQSPLGPGIDVRGPGRRGGGYLVGPGSVVGGLPYLIVRDVPVAPLPDWIDQCLQVHGRRCP
ncbi:bifunctional DNA primase/polymerase [Streptomyces sp. NPDC047065]|uniref:bifunctional DNA primase/polymerase n=1 Tax=Streptomyces sp. NPDC047065 TaxID=3154606 RepID=UPI003405DD0B